MKNLIKIIAFIVSLSAVAQNSVRDMPGSRSNKVDSYEGIPEKNKKVLEAAKSRMGERVGKGICFNLVDYSLCQVDKKWDNRSDSKHIYGKKIKKKDILPGDVVLFKGCRFKDGMIAISHIAIVYFVGDEDKENVKIIEQNAGARNLKESKVVVNDVDLSNDNLIKGKMEFYRPY